MRKFIVIMLTALAVCPVWAAHWVRYEAQNAVLSDGSTVASDATVSDGQYVKINSSRPFDFTITVSTVSTYLMRVFTMGSSLTNRRIEAIIVNGARMVNQQYSSGYYWPGNS